MTTQEQDLHVYEIIGEAVFRRSGDKFPTLCKIVRTRVLFTEEHGAEFLVAIADIVSGYQNCWLPTWFGDWNDKDNIHGDDPQSGRPVDIALEIQDFEELLADGMPRGIIAVRIDDRWVLASSNSNTRRPPDHDQGE